MYFKQKEAISTLNGKSLKVVDQVPYIGYHISSTESDINIRIENVWTAIDRLSVIWKIDLR